MQTLVDLKSFIEKDEIRDASQTELTISSSKELEIGVEGRQCRPYGTKNLKSTAPAPLNINFNIDWRKSHGF